MKKFFYGLSVCLLLVVSVFSLTGCGETIESLGIKNGVIKTEYVVGEAFDRSSGVLVAKIGDRYVDIALTDRAVTIEGFSTETEVASATATIKYKGKSCTFDYSVSLKRVEGANLKDTYSYTYSGTNVKDMLIAEICKNQTAGIGENNIVLTDLEGKPWAGIIDVPDNTNNSVNVHISIQKQGYASYEKNLLVVVAKKRLTAKLVIVSNGERVGDENNAVTYTGEGFDLGVTYEGLVDRDKDKFELQNQGAAGNRPFICTSTKTSTGIDNRYTYSMSSSRTTVGNYKSGIVINSSLLSNYTLTDESNRATIETDLDGNRVVNYLNSGFDWQIKKATVTSEDIERIENGLTFTRYSQDNNYLSSDVYTGLKQKLVMTGNVKLGGDKEISVGELSVTVSYLKKADYEAKGVNASVVSADGVINAGEYKVVFAIAYENYETINIVKDFSISPKEIEIVWKSISDINGEALTRDPNFGYDENEKGVIAVVTSTEGIFSGDLDTNGRLSCLVTENGTATERAERKAKATLTSSNYVFSGQTAGYVYEFTWSIV